MDFDATRTAFSGLIEKPQLTDALLARPPFKFILDVVTNTISKTGYLKSQFPKDELDTVKLNDKLTKTAFLDKLISTLDDGSLGGVKSAKIIAGKEPEQTNLLLLKLAEKARVHLGSTTKERRSSKVKEEKSSSKTSSKDKKEKEKSKDEKKDKDRERSKSKSRKEGNEEKPAKKSSSRSKSKDPKEDKSSSKSSKERSSSKELKVKENKSSDKEQKDKKDREKKKEKKEKEPKVNEDEKENGSRKVPERRLSRAELSQELTADMDEGFSDRNHEEIIRSPMNLSPAKTDDSGVSDLVESPHRAPPPPPEPPLRPVEDREIPRPSTAAARPQTSMGRPGTAAARPAPPKIKKKHIATIEEQVVQTIEPTAVILNEPMNNTSDAADNDFMIEEQHQEEVPAPFEPSLTEIPSEVGGLVKKMMETKAGIEEGNALDEVEETFDDLTKERAKIDSLQKMLQNVTKNTYPLARLFDYAQEDLESMMRELEKWRSETRAIEAELKDREASEFGESNKLSNALSNIENEVRDVKAQLAATKGRIAGNEEKINGILAGL